MLMSYNEYKAKQEAQLQEGNPFQQLRQTGQGLGMRGATKLGGVVDAIVNLASRKDQMLYKIIKLLSQAIADEPNGQQMQMQLKNAYAVLKQASAHQQTPNG